jgi:hypothetical protein
MTVQQTEPFTAADGTEITSLTNGVTHTKHGSFAAISWPVIGNRIRAANTGMVYTDWVPGSPDYAVRLTVRVFSDNNLCGLGPAGRIATGANTAYFFRLNESSNTFDLSRVVAGTGGTIQSVASGALSAGQEFVLELRMVGTAIEGWVDGVLTCSGTDANIAAAGRAGMRALSTTTDTTGLHGDGWQVDDLAVAGGGQPPRTLYIARRRRAA